MLLSVRHRRLCPGFSLVELLVVLAVMTVLASMMVPALQQAREQAQTLSCQDNLRQLHRAFSSFCVEHNHLSMPTTARMGPGNSPPTWSWHDFLALHMRSTPFAESTGGASLDSFMSWNPGKDKAHFLSDRVSYPSSPMKYRRSTPFACPSTRLHSYIDAETSGYADYQVIVDGMPDWDPHEYANEHKYGRYWMNVADRDMKVLFAETGEPVDVAANRPDLRQAAGPQRLGPGPAEPQGVRPSALTLPYGSNVTTRHEGGMNLLHLDGTVQNVAETHTPNPFFYGDVHTNGQAWHAPGNRDQRQ